MNRKIVLALILIIAVSTANVISVKPANAQSISAPSVPQFTVKFIQAYYGGTNPSEGATEIIIVNQLFESPNNSTKLYYGIRLKGHDDDNWTDVYSLVSSSENQLVPENTSSENTIVVFPQWGFWVYGEVDFQVQTVILTAQPLLNTNFGTWTIDGISNWSDTQTINVPTFYFYPTPTPSSSTSAPAQTLNPTVIGTPQNPTTGIQTITGAGYNWTQIALFAAIAIIAALVIAVVALARGRKAATKMWSSSFFLYACL